jgi:hypothetical protein
VSTKAVHLAKAPGEPACGLKPPFGSYDLTTTRGTAKVTCKRPGCAQ